MNLNTEPKIISMANALDLDVQRPVEAIIEYCHAKVARFIRRVGRTANIQELQKIICERLNLIVHEIWNDAEIETLSLKYRDEGEIGVYGAIKSQLKPDTFGMLTQLQRRGANNQVMFVAFIDCRGEKHQRRVFTLWHEIAHCLTAKDQLALPLRRTTAEIIEKDPVEKLTDIIAGNFAFYEPLFGPILAGECGVGRLTFRVVERVRNRFNPEASFVSTLRACVTKCKSPVVLIEAGLAFRKSELKQIAQGTASPEDFTPNLRVLHSIPNDNARQKLPCVHKQIRVPKESIISRIFADAEASFLQDHAARENLGSWTTSTGGCLPAVDVVVEARKVGDRVIALVSA